MKTQKKNKQMRSYWMLQTQNREGKIHMTNHDYE